MVPESARRLLEAPNIALVATINRDGSPQLTPVWVDYEDGMISFNTARGRLKERNLKRDPRLSLTVFDSDNPYAYVQIKGTAELTEEDAAAQTHRLSKKYLDEDVYPFAQEGEVRVKVIVEPDRIQTYPPEGGIGSD